MHGSTSEWIAPDGVRLLSRRWAPARDAKACVLLVHGLCEHSGRYEGLAAHLCGAGYAVRAFDLRGHGRSEARRGHTRFAPTFDDIDGLLAEERGPGLPVFLYGHSLGGLIVLAYCIDRRPAIAGVVASAAALHTALREQRVKVLLTRLLGRVLPGVSVDAGLEATLLSRDPAVVDDYLGDPLVHRRISFGLGSDAMDAIDRVLGDAHRFPAPVLLLHGDADAVNYLSGSQTLASRLGDACTLRVYPGVFHEPHTDPDRPRVFSDLTAWLDRRLEAGR